jgi:rhodanese-related sulfurtransferase
MTPDTSFPWEVTPEQVEAQQNPYVIVDVREDWERTLASLPHVFPCPLAMLLSQEETLKTRAQTHTLYVLCHHGVRSLQAVSLLRQRGLPQVASIKGGIDAWALTFGGVGRY